MFFQLKCFFLFVLFLSDIIPSVKLCSVFRQPDFLCVENLSKRNSHWLSGLDSDQQSPSIPLHSVPFWSLSLLAIRNKVCTFYKIVSVIIRDLWIFFESSKHDVSWFFFSFFTDFPVTLLPAMQNNNTKKKTFLLFVWIVHVFMFYFSVNAILENLLLCWEFKKTFSRACAVIT